MTDDEAASLDDMCTNCAKPRPRYYCWDQNADMECPYGFNLRAGPFGSRPAEWFT